MNDNEIVKQEVNSLITDEVLDMYEQLYIAKAKISRFESEAKTKLLETFKKHNIKSFKSDYMNITYIPASKRKTVDTKALKEDGLYETYLKETVVAEQIRFSFKEAGDE